jgi:hypothetical protein
MFDTGVDLLLESDSGEVNFLETIATVATLTFLGIFDPSNPLIAAE